MESQHTLLHYWEQLNKKNLRDFFIFGLLCIAFFLATAVNPFNTEQPYNEEDPQSTISDHLSLSERLGYAILLNAGYINIELRNNTGNNISINEQKPKEDVFLNFSTISHNDTDLIYQNKIQVNSDNNIDIKQLTIAILAAEKYNRNFFEKKLEFRIASISLKFFGYLPDFSYGIAQIRPSTAKKIFFNQFGNTNITDKETLRLLENDKHNINIAEKYITALCIKHANQTLNTDQIIKKVTAEYNGSNNKTISGLNYSEAVTGAYNILNSINREFAEDEESKESDTAPTTQNIEFEFDNLNYKTDIDYESFKKNISDKIKMNNSQENLSEENIYKKTKIHMHYVSCYPEKEVFENILRAKRINIIKKDLINAGFDPNNITVLNEQKNKDSSELHRLSRTIIQVEAYLN